MNTPETTTPISVKPCFWMVWGEGRPGATTQHETPTTADKEAMRLAAKNPGVRFHVLRSDGDYFIKIPLPEYTLHQPVTNLTSTKKNQ